MMRASDKSHLQLFRTFALRCSASSLRAATISSAVGPRCFRGVLVPLMSFTTCVARGDMQSAGDFWRLPLAAGVVEISRSPTRVCRGLRPVKQRGDGGMQKPASGPRRWA